MKKPFGSNLQDVDSKAQTDRNERAGAASARWNKSTNRTGRYRSGCSPATARIRSALEVAGISKAIMNEVGASTVAATDDVTALKWAQNIKDNI